MKKNVSSIAITLMMSLTLVTAFAFPAFAAGEGGGNPLMDMVWKVLNFVVLVFILFKFGKAPISAAFRGSAKKNADDWNEAEEAKAAVEAELAKFESKLSNMQKEAEEMVEKAKEDAEAEKARIIKEAEEFATQIKEQAKFAIQQEYQKAEADLKQWLVKEAMGLAEEQLQKKVTVQKDRSIVKQFTEGLGNTN